MERRQTGKHIKPRYKETKTRGREGEGERERGREGERERERARDEGGLTDKGQM